MRLATLQAPDGGEIQVQYDDVDTGGLRAVSTTDVVERTARYKDTVSRVVWSYGDMLLSSLEQGMTGVRKPERISLELGLQIGGEAGVPFVTKGTAQANVKVTIDWTLKTEE